MSTGLGFLRAKYSTLHEGVNSYCLQALQWTTVAMVPIVAILSISRFQLFCDPMDCSTPVHGFSQARTLEWAAISFSRGSLYPKIELTAPDLAGGFFTSEPPGKPSKGRKGSKNTLALSMYQNVLRKFCFYLILKSFKNIYLFDCVRS